MKKDFFKEYGFRIVFVVVFLLAFVWMGTKQTIKSNSNSVEDWLPAQFQQTRDYQWYLGLFPFESYVVVSWEGCEIGDDRIELFAQKLVPEQTIDNFSLAASTGDFKADLELKTTPEDAKEEMRAFAGETNASTEALLEASGADLPTDQTAQENKSSNFKSVMTGPRLARLLLQTYAKTPQYARVSGDPEATARLEKKIVERLKGTLIGPDGKSTAMIVTLNKGKRDGKSLQGVLEEIRLLSIESGLPDTAVVQTGSVAQKMVENFTGMIDEMINGRKVRMDGVIMGGPPVDNVALTQEGERTLYRLAGICALIGVTVAYVCLRSFRLTMFVFWVSALSAGFALAFVSLTGGTCDTILLSMPALVYVLGMSGAVHLINYYHDAIREGGLNGATERAVRHGFTPCFFAQLTTALGLGSLFAGRLIPIAKFGFYSAIGVLLTLLLLFLYLPALLYFYPSKKFAAQHGGKGLEQNQGKLHGFWDWLGGLIVRRHRWVLVGCFALMGFCAYHLPQIKTSVKMMSFFSSDAEIIKNYTWLEEKLGPLVPMEVVICFDNKKLNNYSFGTADRLSLINRLSENLKRDLPEDVGGTLSVALFAPDVDDMSAGDGLQRLAVSTVVGKAIDENRSALRDYLTIEGNPTIDELEKFLRTRATLEREKLAARRAEFDAKLRESGLSLDEAFELDSPEGSVEKTSDWDEKFSPFLAEFQNFRAAGKEVERIEEQARVLAENREYLTAQGIADLQGLLAATSSDRSFRKLSPSELTALSDGAKRWQNERGIEVWRISVRVWSLKKDIDYSAFIDSVKNVVEPTLAERSLQLTEAEAEMREIAANALRSEADAKDAVDRRVQEKTQKFREYLAANKPDADASKKELAENDPKTLAREFALKGLSAEERDELQNSMGPTHVEDWIYPAGFAAKYTGMVPLVYKTQHELINGLTVSLLMAFVLIMFVFVVLLRSVPAGFIAMIPNIFPVVVVFGFMAWAGILVDVGTMMTASVALGVAVDDTMHYLTWFSEGIGTGLTPKEAARNAYRRCAPAMTQSTLIAGLGLFSFAFSTFVPTQRFGVLMLAILFTASFGDLIFLPALLTCKPFGRFFLKRRLALGKGAADLEKEEAEKAKIATENAE